MVKRGVEGAGSLAKEARGYAIVKGTRAEARSLWWKGTAEKGSTAGTRVNI